MKPATFLFVLLLTLSLACSLGGLYGGVEETATSVEPSPPSQKRCGDGVCDGPENPQNCPQDCAPTEAPTEVVVSTPVESPPARQEIQHNLLYHVSEITGSITQDVAGLTCYNFNFLQFLDAGYVQSDGSGNVALKLRDHPTSKVTSKVQD